ncbi:polyprenyl synthetase family protein [Cytobacillus suaedae]|nr:polyprenyl synthetase family protein [Cytobacillus suaedae]
MIFLKEELVYQTDEWYRSAEERAASYFTVLFEQLKDKTYVPILTKDIQTWKQSHIHHWSLFSLFSRKNREPSTKEYHAYIQYLNYTGKLEDYLNRSISYLYMRDLGKALDSVETQTKIQQVVGNLKNSLLDSTPSGSGDSFNLAGVYRWAQKEGIESTFIWMITKLRNVASNIPEGMEAEHAQRKLIKIIAGVLMQEIEEMGDNVPPEERKHRLEKAIRLGYSYGLTYPFIDDLLDANILSPKETMQYTELIRTTLTTGYVPELRYWSGSNKDLIYYIHSELREAFQYIKSNQRPETEKIFLEQAYVFFQSQEVDREKSLSNGTYTNEELYIPVILKSSSSRLIVRTVITASEDEDIDNRTFYYGIYNQLADDFADMFDDMKDGSVTPYTYYLKYHEQRKDLINPFELYWTVISNLIHNVYQSDPNTREVILDRAINGLKRFKKRAGTLVYNEVMEIFSSGNPSFNRLLQTMVKKAADVDFFDKLLRDRIIAILKKDKKEREAFGDKVEKIRKQINDMLPIDTSSQDDPVTEAANYSLKGDGKRLRPIITWVMGVEGYGLAQTSIVPILKSLEYMHTASLIFDDLPSQDNAKMRRGRPTLHQVKDVAVAELTGLFLTQKAIEEQTMLDHFDAKTVVQLIQYTTRITGEMCKGQVMDLEGKGKRLSLEQLEAISLYKTGIAFEASLIMPAILGKATEQELNTLKEFARHAGIAFQIKDDLLDAEGDVKLLGKSPGKDIENNNSTFVTILGIEDARKELWEHYCLAMEALEKVPRNTTFLKHLVNYIVNRDH